MTTTKPGPAASGTDISLSPVESRPTTASTVDGLVQKTTRTFSPKVWELHYLSEMDKATEMAREYRDLAYTANIPEVREGILALARAQENTAALFKKAAEQAREAQ